MCILKRFIWLLNGGPFVLSFDLGSSSAAPAPDPLIGQSALKTAQISDDALDWYKKTYANDIKPRQDAADAQTAKINEDYLDTSRTNKYRSTQQWDRFVSTFQPVEDKTVSDAMEYDSIAAQDKAAGDAATAIQSQFDNASAQNRRAITATGVNPNSGKAMSLEKDSALKLAAIKAGSANEARTGVKDRAIALRTGVANFGRNMPNTAATSLNSSMGANGGAVAATGANNSMALNGINTMGAGFNAGISGNQAAGNIALGGYGAQMNGWAAQQQADATSSAGFGKLVGTLGGAAIIRSSKKIKTKTGDISDAEVVDKLSTLPVDKWKYDEGVADGGEHIGPYAEDVQRAFGDKAAPGGKAIDVVSMMGIQTAAIKGLAKQTKQLESKVARIASAGTMGA